MSLQFSNTTTKGGMIQVLERNLKLDDGAISGNATLFKKMTSDINLGLAKVWALIFASNDTWQWDDTNYEDYPIITTDLVDGQRDYAFLTDNSGALVLDIYKVMVKNHDGVYMEIYPVDVQSEENTADIYDGRNIEGIPYRYDKTANGIFLDPIPDENSTNGLKVYINREGSFFTSSDTTKKPGFAALFHEYPVIWASEKNANRDSMKSIAGFRSDRLEMEAAIKKHYARRQRDVQNVLEAPPINSV